MNLLNKCYQIIKLVYSCLKFFLIISLFGHGKLVSEKFCVQVTVILLVTSYPPRYKYFSYILNYVAFLLTISNSLTCCFVELYALVNCFHMFVWDALQLYKIFVNTE